MGIQRLMHQATVTYKMSPRFPKEKENHRLEVNAAAKSITNFWEAFCRQIPRFWHYSVPWQVLSHYINLEFIDSLFSEKSLFGWDEYW